MGYRELLQALEEEVGRQVRELQEQARREGQRLLEETRRQVAAEREEVLTRERRRFEEEAGRALSRARLEQERGLLGEKRRLLAELRREAEARLPGLGEATLLARLADELVPELGDGPLEFRVDKGQEEYLRQHLSQRHPGLLLRATITGAADRCGGVKVSLAGRQLLDNTLPSRLQKAWPLLEGGIATILFGEGDGGV